MLRKIIITFMRIGCFFVSSHLSALEVTVQSNVGAGFFAELYRVVDAIIHFEDQGLSKIKVDWSQPFFPYKKIPSQNGWSLYFEDIPSLNNNSINRRIVAQFPYHELHDQNLWIYYDQLLSYRLIVHDCIQKYIKINDEIVQKVEEYHRREMVEFFCIGAHVRYAKAHNIEIPGETPMLQDYYDEVDRIITTLTVPYKIFLATDSHYVVEEFKKRYGNKNLIYIDAHRSNDTQDPHLIFENTRYWMANPNLFHEKKPGYFGGLTCLMDCLLLSKCNIYIHTTSNFSDFVCFFNPHIDSVYLPKTVHIKQREKNWVTHIKNRWNICLKLS